MADSLLDVTHGPQIYISAISGSYSEDENRYAPRATPFPPLYPQTLVGH